MISQNLFVLICGDFSLQGDKHSQPMLVKCLTQQTQPHLGHFIIPFNLFFVGLQININVNAGAFNIS